MVRLTSSSRFAAASAPPLALPFAIDFAFPVWTSMIHIARAPRFVRRARIGADTRPPPHHPSASTAHITSVRSLPQRL